MRLRGEEVHSEQASRKLDAALRKALIGVRERDVRAAEAARTSVAFPSASAQFTEMVVGAGKD